MVGTVGIVLEAWEVGQVPKMDCIVQIIEFQALIILTPGIKFIKLGIAYGALVLMLFTKCIPNCTKVPDKRIKVLHILILRV